MYKKKGRLDDNTSGDYDEAIAGTISGHKYVNLGLPSGLIWATCNVGATSAEDYGDYFALGETSPKVEYNNCIICGKQMGCAILGNAQYDAATANWGGSWSMPTIAELKELIDNLLGLGRHKEETTVTW